MQLPALNISIKDQDVPEIVYQHLLDRLNQFPNKTKNCFYIAQYIPKVLEHLTVLYTRHIVLHLILKGHLFHVHVMLFKYRAKIQNKIAL